MRPLTAPLSPLVIENVKPCVDDGKFPIKRVVGDTLTVTATIFRDGHAKIVPLLKYKEKCTDQAWIEVEMVSINPGLDLWQGSFKLEKNTRYLYTIEAFTDIYYSWLVDATKKFDAGQDIPSDLLEGQQHLEETLDRLEENDYLSQTLAMLSTAESQAGQMAIFSEQRLKDFMKEHSARKDAATFEPTLEVIVDRLQARYSAWYEMFPRSQGTVPGQSGTFADCKARLPEIKRMGFDVIYLPPIHPIGVTNRKGRNNSLVAGPNDPGSPWAIGSEHGGHKAVEPSLGTLEDFMDFEQACRQMGMEVALDFALNCSPDHPYLKDHPEWFLKRPDGTIKYSENPPKKYEDIHSFDYEAPNGAWKALWEELKDVLLFWAERGVRIFRVDNPHTKSIPFWEWVIAEVQDSYPDTIFLAEAFTRPAVMKRLGKIGFTQSYTYFTWRNFKREIIEYLTELTQAEMKEYYRGNFFANTPDILPEILQVGRRPAFKMRFALAATLSSVYGIYSSYELGEAAAIEGKEEYLNSEKYEIKVWDWDRPGNIKDYIALINKIRRENPALHLYDNLKFHEAASENVLFYSKATPDQSNIILAVVNLNPFSTQQARLDIPIDQFKIGPDDPYRLHNLITGESHLCRGREFFVTLDPHKDPAYIFRLGRWLHTEEGFDYFGM
ncbi:MAG: alpha-1,4-glucan--maltose-1-phosphate maltosyltransferase [Anaerolineaceae bacterium]|nr:alpha-1,4-glucan--maltose-1-phosphate maltosyltransferase [Anaerolineaceae bacterium]MCB9100327.1 alpha-1,4-glucan--maltose-1-phosphate maltosyltransferase [Anaerolineales bacterium]